ncbi:hypothetical protein [Methylobacterium sp. W2]|uniref:hypothetical protein n=1 Tax=Methylobacterium sp. W2 TaxID=2598107 RepID=UPI001D0C62BB|nr:hypothetical protein [Methylobacterium sp. W2]
MDVIYRGLETSLLGLTLVLGIAAFALPSLAPRMLGAPELAVTLPLLSVTAER